MWDKQLCRHQGQWKKMGKRCSRQQSRDSPAAFRGNYGEAAVPLHVMEVHGSRDPPAARGRRQARKGDVQRNCMYEYPLNQAPGRIYGLMEREAHPEAGFKAGLVTPWGVHTRLHCA